MIEPIMGARPESELRWISDIDDKLNEVISELNRRETGGYSVNGEKWPKESAKRTITTPPGRELHLKNNGSKDLVLVVEQGDFVLPGALISAKKEHNFTLEHQGTDPEPLVITGKEDYTLYTKEDIDEAVEAYKKKLLGKLVKERLRAQQSRLRGRASCLGEVIELLGRTN